jgi:hypothetical protein
MKRKYHAMGTRTFIIAALALFAGQALHGQLKVRPSGNVGIGTSDPAARLHVMGEGVVDSYTGPWESAFTTRIHYRNAGAYRLWNGYYDRDVFFVNGEGWLWSMQGHYVGADSSLLTSLTPIDSPLNSVMLLNGARFRYWEEQSGEDPGSYRLGLVAQQVRQVVPEAVRVMPDSSLAIAYTDMIPLLVEAMKQQQEQIGILRAALSEQAEQISQLKKRRRFRQKPDEEKGAE